MLDISSSTMEPSLTAQSSSDHLSPEVRQSVLSSFPHYGHSGIVESARELFMQIDGQPGDKDGYPTKDIGFLHSLLGPRCECHGYKVCIVGHSLGGAVGTLLGLMLYRRYPDLHVYSYGTLPCLDSVVAEACSDFVTTIVYNDEFSARLSVNSIIRLRAAAITALPDNSSSGSAVIRKLAQQILQTNSHNEGTENHNVPTSSLQSVNMTMENSNQICWRNHFNYIVRGNGEPGQEYLFRDMTSLTDIKNKEIVKEGLKIYNNEEALGCSFDVSNNGNTTCFNGSGDLISFVDQTSQVMDGAPSSVEISVGETPEMFLPGLIIHIVPEQRSMFPLWTSNGYKAFIAKRENFKDIVVTPYMFLDHLPWRCHYAMQRVLETRKADGQLNVDVLGGEHIV